MARPARPLPTEPQSGVLPAPVARFLDLVTTTVPPVHRSGVPFIAGGLGLAALGRRRRGIRLTGLVTAGACAAFFRHPPRVPPTRPGLVVAPADGLVTLIETAVPPTELGMPATPMTRVSIFLSIFDAHVQRAPVAGEVRAVVHRPGEYLSAERPEASEANERNSLWLRTPDGTDVVAVQIAGLVARRIVCTATTGDNLALGQTYGLIRFGSRLDTYLPAGAEVLVTVGQRAVAGETPLAGLPR